MLWRARDKLRKAGIMVTEDSTARLAKLRHQQEEEEKEEGRRRQLRRGRTNKKK